MIRAVLDTNVVVSALLFEGRASRLVPLWQQRRFVPIISRAVLEEYLQVLAYPKFELTAEEIQEVIDELLPYAGVTSPKGRVKVVRRDPADNKFLDCAVAGKAQYVVSGDQDLLSLTSFRGIPVVTVSEFLAIVEGARS